MKIKRIYLLSIIVLVIAALFSTGYYHFDEHFQILEFAGLKLKMTIAENLPWEYHYQMRPSLQPSIVVLAFNFLKLFGITDPFILASFLRLLSAAVAFTGMYLIYKAYSGSIINETLKRWFTLLSFFLWFMIFNNVRFSSESWSGSMFLIGYSLTIIKPPARGFNWFVTGLILGLSFLFRYQAGFLILGFIMWHLFMKKELKGSLLMATGALVMTGAGVLIDRWYYGEWTSTAWNYFNQNIILQKSADFGVSPWWKYIEMIFLKAIPPFSLVFIISVILVLFFRWNDLLVWTIFPFLLIHFLTMHKELRFLFPVIGFIPVIIVKSLELIKTRWYKDLLVKGIVRKSACLFWVVNLVFLIIIALKPADNQISLYYKVYKNYREPAIMYFTEENPYNRVLDIFFYKRPGLTIKKVDSVKEIEPDTVRKQLFVTSDTNILAELNSRGRLVYSTFPEWLRFLNINDWISRANMWYVYEL